MKKFVERPIVDKIYKIGVICLIISALSVVSLFWTNMFMFSYGVLFLLVTVICFIVSEYMSIKPEYTITFLEYIRTKKETCTTADEFNSLLLEFENIAIEDGIYILSYPNSLKYLHNELIESRNLLE